MEYVRLGKTGLKVSRICLGTMTYGSSKWRDWVLDEDSRRAPSSSARWRRGSTSSTRRTCILCGASEEVTGRALRDFAKSDEVVVATKVFNRMGPDPNAAGLSRKHIMAGIDASLRRLGMDHVDLYQIHRWDPETPIEETMEALNDVVRAGKARYIGASSMYAWQFMKVTRRLRPPRLGALRFHAEPLQPRLPRGGAGDDPAVHRPGSRRDSLEPARAGVPLGEQDEGQGRGDDAQQVRRVRALHVLPGRRLQRGGPPEDVAAQVGHDPPPGRSGMDALEARASPRRSSGRASPSTSTRRSKRCRSGSPPSR